MVCEKQKPCPACHGLKGTYKHVTKGTKDVKIWVPCSFCLGVGKKNTL